MNARTLMQIHLLPALVCVIALNFALLCWDPVSRSGIDPEELPAARTWSWWGAQDWARRQPIDIVLLGSSAMMQGPWFQEAQYRQKNVELIEDHQSTYLQSVIKKNSGLDTRCFNFAL